MPRNKYFKETKLTSVLQSGGSQIKTYYTCGSKIRFAELIAPTGIAFFVSIDPVEFPIVAKEGPHTRLYKTSEAFETHFQGLRNFLATIPQAVGDSAYGGISVSGDFFVSSEGIWTPSEEISKRDIGPVADLAKAIEEVEDIAGVLTVPQESSSESSEDDNPGIIIPGEKVEIILDDRKDLKTILSDERPRKKKRTKKRNALVDDLFLEVGVTSPIIDLKTFFKLVKDKKVIDKMTLVRRAIDDREKAHSLEKADQIDQVISDIRSKVVRRMTLYREEINALELENSKIRATLEHAQLVLDRKLAENRETLLARIQKAKNSLRANSISIARLKEDSKDFLNGHLDSLREILTS
jgi:hypothetical protein